MGTYLSTPSTDKITASSTPSDIESSNLAWAVVELQGWRASMEDAHVATRVMNGDDSYIFAVLDGHGGPHVSRFVSCYLAAVVRAEKIQQQDNSSSSIANTLIHTFHRLDALIPERMDEVLSMKDYPPRIGEQRVLEIDADQYIPEEAKAAMAALKEAEAAEQEAKRNGDNAYLVDLDAHYDELTSSAAKKKRQQQNGGSTMIDLDAAYDDDRTKKDDDSLKVLGKQQAANDDDDDDLTLLDGDDQVDIEVLESNDGTNGESGTRTISADVLRKILLQSRVTPLEQRSVTVPSVLHPDTQQPLCNLPEHPVTAGTTAIVVWYTTTPSPALHVANAGDSRAVLSRAGQAVPLSVDHKPSQPIERARIEKAGGFLAANSNRVNGNLNLSRCIGDLKYKQHPHLQPHEQMITAQPDVTKFSLGVLDDFFLLGCDGIWDCLTNQQAVDYVRKRIHTERPAQIGASLVDSILAKGNPREARGIGCDNMTILIVDLKPKQRSYYKPSTPSDMIEI